MREVKFLSLYVGTSEIQRNIVSMFRMRDTVRSKGAYYGDMADKLGMLPEETGGPLLARAVQTTNRVILGARKKKLTRSQHIMFLLADMMTWCEVGDSLCHKAATYDGGQKRTPAFINAAARLFAREVAEKVYVNGCRIIHGCDQVVDEAGESLDALDLGPAMKGNLKDMDLVAAELVA